MALCLVQFVDVLGVTSATTAIPAMTADLSAPEWSTGVLATVYAMFFGAFLILGARLGDRYGHRRVLLVGVAMFTVVALVGMSAQEIVQLVVARALQGLAAAISVPSALRLLLHLTPQPGRRSTAVAAWGASGAAAGALGFLAGGFLTDLWSWRAIYWINLPIGIALLVVLTATVPPPARDKNRPSLDLVGASLLVTAIMAVVVGTSMVERAELRLWGTGAIAVGILVTLVFLVQQRRASEPLVPRQALATANLRTGTVVSFVNTATTSSAGVLVTLHLQQQRGASPLEAGLSLLPFSLAVIIGSALAGPLARRLSSRRLASLGLTAMAGGDSRPHRHPGKPNRRPLRSSHRRRRARDRRCRSHQHRHRRPRQPHRKRRRHPQHRRPARHRHRCRRPGHSGRHLVTTQRRHPGRLGNRWCTRPRHRGHARRPPPRTYLNQAQNVVIRYRHES